ncbi:hypothetical protein JX266_014413, partial [Neoarthrinium moseri]
ISAVSKVSRTIEELMLKCQEASRKRKDFAGLKGVDISSENPILELFSKIVNLKTGEALVFAPSAIVGLQDGGRSENGNVKITHKRLGHHVLHAVIRARITQDGGQSVMAE